MVLLSFLFVLMSVELSFLCRMYQYSRKCCFRYVTIRAVSRRCLLRLSPLYPLMSLNLLSPSATFMATKRKREDDPEVNVPDEITGGYHNRCICQSCSS